MGQTDNYVDLHVYGVDEVGEEISVQLRRLLESRLVDFAMSVLSELLSRNPQFQLNPADLEFIQSGGQQKDTYCRAVIELPPLVIRDPYLFMLYLRQNMVRSQFINNLHIQSGQPTSSSRRAPSLTSPGGKRPSPTRHHSYLSSNGSIDMVADALSQTGQGGIPQEKPGQMSAGISDVADVDLVSWPTPVAISNESSVSVRPMESPTPGLEIEVDPMTFKFYYNHSRPEIYETRKDFATSLTNKGMKLVRDVGRGIALMYLNLADRQNNPFRRVRTAVGPSLQEVEDVLKIIEGTKEGKPLLATTVVSTSDRARYPDLADPTVNATSGSPERTVTATRAEERWDLSALGVSVEVAGFVNAPPVVEWIKLCVDQTLYDYLMERLLYSMRQPPFLMPLVLDLHNQSGDKGSTSSPDDASTPVKVERPSMKRSLQLENTDRRLTDRIIRPLEPLMDMAMALESPSIRKFEASEVMPVLDFPRFVHALCQTVSQVHLYFQSTLKLYEINPEDKGGIQLVDSMSLVTRPLAAATRGHLPEYIMLCGLRNDLGRPESPVNIEGLSPPPRLKGKMPSQAEESLGATDVLYPGLTTAEGATVEMQTAKVTQRETVLWLHITGDKQTLMVYNGHPHLFQRCTAAMQNILSFVALYRFILEGICLQRLGMVPLDLPWWKRIPGLQEVFEGLTMEPAASPRRSPPAGGHTSIELRPANQPRTSQADKTERPPQTPKGEGANMKLDDSASRAAAVASSRKSSDHVPVMTPAMAARLRASGRAVPQHMNMRRKIGGQAPLPPSNPSGTAKPRSSSGAPAPTASSQISIKTSSSFQESLSESNTPRSSEATWRVPHRWMLNLIQSGDADQMASCRRLSMCLLPVIVDICPPPPLDMAALEVLCTSPDPLRIHVSRLNELVVEYFRFLNNRMKLGSLCRTWTWQHSFGILQQRVAQLHLRTHRPLELPPPGKAADSLLTSSTSP